MRLLQSLPAIDSEVASDVLRHSLLTAVEEEALSFAARVVPAPFDEVIDVEPLANMAGRFRESGLASFLRAVGHGVTAASGRPVGTECAASVLDVPLALRCCQGRSKIDPFAPPEN